MTGFETYTDEELVELLYQKKQAVYNIESEQRHRLEAIESEKYKDIIGKIFYEKNKSLYKVLKVVNNEYICKSIHYLNTLGKFKLQTDYSKGFWFDQQTTILSFDGMEEISEEEANTLIEAWKRDCVKFEFQF